MPRSHPFKRRKSSEIARARRTTSTEGVGIETRPFSFTSRGKCTRASHDSFLTSRDNRPDYCSSATGGSGVSVQRELFFYPFLSLITRASVCDLTYDVLRVIYIHFVYACNDQASSARDILTRHHRRNRFHTCF